MMKKHSFALILLSAVLSFGAMAADKLAVAEPVNKGGMKAQDIEAVWGMLEATVDGGYELISRSALKSMMTEIGLTTSSDLMNLNSSQKARLGELKTVKYLLVPTVSKFGTRINFSLIVVDSSTGSVDPDKKISETYNSLDEMADKLKDTLSEIGFGPAIKKRGRSAVILPIIKTPNPPPEYLADEFNTGLEEKLLDGNIKLINLQAVKKIFRKNKIDDLNEAEPAMYRRIGDLLRVDYLVQARVIRFSVIIKKVYVEVTRKYTTTCIGNIGGDVRIIAASTGDVVASFTFSKKVDFDDVDDTDDWTPHDYGSYLIKAVLPQVTKKAINRLKR